MLNVGMLTSGGDCQALNAAIRGVAKTLYHYYDDVVIYGFTDGYRGLMKKEFRVMTERDFSGILNIGGTILGTSRTQYKYINEPLEDGSDKLESMINTYKELNLDCLVILGGNGSHKTADLLRRNGLNIITLPKTIDNDLEGTSVSFGFNSALEIATNAIDRIHTTAASHSRVFILELMGHKTGWLTLHAGIAGGADIILIPELPYDINVVIDAITKRTEQGKKFTIIAMAEGALSKEEAAMTKKQRKTTWKDDGFPSLAFRLGSRITSITGQEVRVTVPGHVQRGGEPSAYDRVLATRLGVEAARLIVNSQFGLMVCADNDQISTIPLEEVAGKTKLVNPECQLIRQAEDLGICLGQNV